MVSAADVGDDGSEKPRLQAVEARSKDQGAHGSGYGQPGPEGGSDQTHGAGGAPGSHMGGPGVRGPVPVKRQQSDAHNRERHGPAQPPRRAGGRGGAAGGRRPGRGGGADAAQRRSGQTDAGQRQQATAPQPATRPQEGKGGGGESCQT